MYKNNRIIFYYRQDVLYPAHILRAGYNQLILAGNKRREPGRFLLIPGK